MAIFRGTGGAGDSTDDSIVSEVTEQAGIATTKAQEAATSATNASNSASSASSSETAASNSATAAAGSASTATTKASEAASHASDALASKNAAATSATAAADSATAANSANVQTVAGLSTEITNLNGIRTDITGVNAVRADVVTVSGISSDVTTVAADASDIGTVATNITNVNNVGDNISNVNAVHSNASNINTVAADGSDIGTVAGNISNVNTVAGISSDVTTVAGLESKMDAVIADASDIGAVAGNIGNVNTVAGDSSDINTVAGISADVTSVADNMTDVQNADTNAANAATSASNASDSASAASTSAGSASSSASSASTSATNAGNSATTASNSATAASASKDAAASSASAASGSASAAASSASAASTSASNADTSETNAASSATAAATSASDASSSASQIIDLTVDTGAAGSEASYDSGSGVLTVPRGDTGSVTLNSVSGNLTFGDNDKATFGAGDDLQIYHDGSNSIIEDTSTGNLQLITNGNAIALKSSDGDAMVSAIKDGDVKLYFNNNQKLATTSTGIDVTGEITADGLALGDGQKATFGASDDLQIYHDGSHSYISDIGTGNLRIRGTDITLQDASGNGYISMVDGGAGGTVYLKHLGNNVLATTSTGIDVTGTATMDGLVVDGNAAVAGTTGVTVDTGTITTGKDSGNTRTHWRMNNPNGEVAKWDSNGTDLLHFITDEYKVYTAGNKAFEIDGNGDISFYEDTGTTAKLFWDASAESLGIGTSSPSRDLSLNSSGTTTLQITNDTVGTATTDGFQIKHYTNGATQLWGYENNYMAFATNNAERMRIDSSGNLLVGKTGASVSTAGAELRADGQISSTRSGDTPVFINRLTNDGKLIDFRKDNTTVGSIGVLNGNNLSISGSVSNHTGIQFGTAVIAPMKSGAENDGDVDLGFSNARFKDLYLSGGVYLGGTGAANKLDDYESGESTALTMTTETSGSITLNTSYDTFKYTKIGDRVTVSGQFVVSSVSSPVGNKVFLPLPFTSASGASKRSGTAAYYYTGSGVESLIPCGTQDGAAFLTIHLDASTIAATHEFWFDVTYQAG